MAEYINLDPQYGTSVESFFGNAPEAEVSLEFVIPEKDFNVAGKGSAEVKNLLKRLGIDPEILRRVAVASYEAEINVAAHSRGGKMVSDVYDELIHISFIDEGPGIKDIDQAMQPGFSTADDLVREMGFGAGLGLPNIKKNSDWMKLSSEYGQHTCLEFIIFFE